MATEAKTSWSYVKYAFGFFIILILILAMWYLLTRVFAIFPQETRVLPPETFSSQVERRSYIDKEGKEVVYYVVASRNNSTNNLFQCQVTLTAKGTQKKYLGFRSQYTERDCYRVGTEVKVNYDCRLGNGVNKFLHYKNAITLARFPAQSNNEISVGSFYQYQIKPAESFLSTNRLTEIFDYTIECKDDTGRTVTHTQTF